MHHINDKDEETKDGLGDGHVLHGLHGRPREHHHRVGGTDSETSLGGINQRLKSRSYEHLSEAGEIADGDGHLVIWRKAGGPRRLNS